MLVTPPDVTAVVFFDGTRSSACGDFVRRSGLCRGAENAAKAMEKGRGQNRGAQIFRCGCMVRGTVVNVHFSLFLFSFAQQGRSSHGGLASPHGTSEIATLLFFFFPRGGTRGGVFFDNTCCVCCCPGGKAEEGTPSPPQVSVPSFATSIFRVPFLRLERWPFTLFFFFYFSFCCWRLFLVSCKRFPASSVLLFVRGWWKEREKGQLYLGKWLLNCLCGAQ